MPPVIHSGPLSPAPGAMQTHPWRFTLGQPVYITKRATTRTFEVIGGFLRSGFPHLYVRDSTGRILRVPQLHCSSRPIVTR